MDISPYPIFIHSKGFIKYANQFAKRLLNIEKEEEAAGINLMAYIHPDDMPELKEVLDRNDINRISNTLDFRVIDLNGQVRRVQSRSTSISYGGERCRLLHIYDFDGVKLAQEEIHQKEVLLDKLIEVLPDSLVVVNSVTRKQIYNNKSFTKNLGYTEEDYGDGDEFDLILRKIHPDDMPKLVAARKLVNDPANVGKLVNTEYRILNKAGEWRWILGRSCSLMPSEDGVGTINFGIVQDITNLKDNQQELIDYHIFQEKINSTSPVLVTIFDVARMTAAYRSQDMAQWFNYPEGALPERTIDLIHPEYRQEAIESIRKVAEMKDGEIQSMVYPYLGGDGGIKFILTRSTVFQRDEAGVVTHHLVAHSDITDLKEIESKLDKSEETRKAILDAIPDIVVIVNTKGVIADFYANEIFRSEIDPAKFIGKNLTDLMGDDTYGEIMRLVRDTIDQNKLNSFNFEYPTSERIYYYELRISPFSGEEVIILARDISDQKIARDKIDSYNEELFHKNEELERYITSNSELEKFAYIASHDLREPLRSLTGFAQLLQKRNQGKLTRESEEFIENIIQGAQRMNTLVSGLLEYSRITTAGKPFTNVNLTDLIKKVKSDLKVSIEENKAELILFDLPDIYCDELQLRQLFQNLISNAIKFRSASPPIIKISSEKSDRHWIIKVEDNGMGIDMKYKDLVFQLFSRLHSQDKYQGSGIGLSVCKKILERHGGQIWLESILGRGTTIFFTILI